MMRLEVVHLYGDAPMQALGYLNGWPFYFRARGDRWVFAVGAMKELSFDLAINASAGHGSGLVVSKCYKDTSRMTEASARAIIQRAAKAVVAFLE